MEYIGLKYWCCSTYNKKPGVLEDWGDLYEISKTGDIRDAITKEPVKKIKRYDRNYVELYRDGKKYSRSVYRSVASSFPEICGYWGEGYEVDHISSNPEDDRAENLRWVSSHKENMANPATREKIRKGQEARREYYRSLWKGWKPGTLKDFYKYKYS